MKDDEEQDWVHFRMISIELPPDGTTSRVKTSLVLAILTADDRVTTSQEDRELRVDKDDFLAAGSTDERVLLVLASGGGTGGVTKTDICTAFGGYENRTLTKQDKDTIRKRINELMRQGMVENDGVDGRGARWSWTASGAAAIGRPWVPALWQRSDDEDGQG